MKYSRLCSLIHLSLHSFTTDKSISKQEEKLLLINLSQVLIQIKLWISEFDSDSISEQANPSNCHSSPSECLLNITNQLLFLLALESRYVQHLVGNVLVSIADFVLASGSYWEDFVQSLFFQSELIICKVILPSSDLLLRAKHLDLDLRLALDNAGWHSVGAVLLVLRSILKHLKHEDDDNVLEVFMKALGTCLQVIPWDLCNSVLIDVIEFCGYLVQLFCSVAVSQGSSQETVAINEILNIFPKLFSWCFCKKGESRNYTCVSQYIRYKILVLMIRLSSIVYLDCEKILSWLHLIDKNFKDLLFESVTQPEADQDDFLKDSPFKATSHRHLQRRVVFLYLTCVFRLTGLKERCKKQCLCGDVNSCSKKGFTALYEWLETQLPANIHVNPELYDYSCKNFTKSFLLLYMHEDDMLFEVLLQLSYTPFGNKQINLDLTSDVVDKNTLVLLTDIFNPVNIFHLFLSELHYDHEVLLDYLISKDIGARCAEYLLRCLRIVCDKWTSFMEFSFHMEAGSQSFPKRRKVTSDSGIQLELSSKTDHKNVETCKQPFDDARDCLLVLKKSIESLHQKDLFPYNPQVLLRRLTKFQELC